MAGIRNCRVIYLFKAIRDSTNVTEIKKVYLKLEKLVLLKVALFNIQSNSRVLMFLLKLILIIILAHQSFKC